MAQVTLLGYYGFGNAGDEAVLAGVITRLRAADSSVKITVISGNPEETSRVHGVQAIGRGSFAQICALLKKTDLFLLGGGGLLQDRTSRRSLWYYLGMAFWARISGAQVACYAIGAGPLRHSSSRRLIRKMLSVCSFISVRDDASADTLLRCYIGKHKRQGILNDCVAGAVGMRVGFGGRAPAAMEITADAALAIPAIAEEEKTQLLASLAGRGERSALSGGSARHEGPVLHEGPALHQRPALHQGPSPRYITVAIRPCSYWQLDQPWLETLAKQLREAAFAMDARVVLLPMHDGVDQPISETLASLIGERALVVKTTSYREAAAMIAVSEFVLAMRLHALIFAALSGVPAIGIEYDKKVGSFAQMAGYTVVAPPDIHTIDLAGHWREFNRQAQAAQLLQLQAAEAKHAAILERMLGFTMERDAGGVSIDE
jgi:polysaccharide pyruvyl transferase WcaK-like protein